MQRALPVVVMAALLVVGLLGLGAAIAPVAADAHGRMFTRTVDESSPAPDESMTVTTVINVSEWGNFTMVEELNPGLAPVEIVDADDADFSGVCDGNDELFATYGNRENATLVYEVIAADNATVTTRDLTSYDDFGLEDIRASTTGDEEISVSSDAGVSVVWSVDETTLEPGESTTVRVEVNHDRVTNFTLVEAFIPVFNSVAIVGADGVDFPGVRDANDELFTTYGGRETVSLVCEVTAADDGGAGTAYQFDGFAGINGSGAVAGGTDELDVQSGSDDDDSWDLTRSIDDETPDPGESVVVSVEITGDEATNFTVAEEFDPGFASVEIVDADGADFSRVRGANDEPFATYDDRENVTFQYRVTAGEDVDGDTSYRLNGFTQFDADGKEMSADGVETLAASLDDDAGDSGDGGGGDSDDDDDDRDDDDDNESDDDDTDDGDSDTPESTDSPDDGDNDDTGDDGDDSNDGDDDSGDSDDSNDGDDDDTGDDSDGSNDGDDTGDGFDGSDGDSGGTPETTTDNNTPATTTTDTSVPGFGVSVALVALVIGSVLLAHRRAT